MHRFLPALMLRQGGRVISVPVSHRPRMLGRSHYGVWNRLWVGIVDLLGVIWLRRRMRLAAVQEQPRPAGPAPMRPEVTASPITKEKTMEHDPMWLVIGFAGQGLFSMRFIVQWLKSEREKKSVVPLAFWYFSLAGGAALTAVCDTPAPTRSSSSGRDWACSSTCATCG